MVQGGPGTRSFGFSARVLGVLVHHHSTSRLSNARTRTESPTSTSTSTITLSAMLRSPCLNILPSEILDYIFLHLSPLDLARLLTVHSVLSRIATRRLYRRLALSSHQTHTPSLTDFDASADHDALSFLRSLKCLRAIVRSPSRALLVRSLCVDFVSPDRASRLYAGGGATVAASPMHLGNVYALLARALHMMNNLTSLSINLSLTPKINSRGLSLAFSSHLNTSMSPGRHILPYMKMITNPYTILENAPFRLVSLETNSPCDDSLALFLSSQPTLKDLTLRAWSPTDESSHGLVQPLFPPTCPHSQQRKEFTLPPTALPRLNQFRAIHASPRLLQQFVSGRPVRSLYIPLYPRNSTPAIIPSGDNVYPSLAVLKESSVPITRLTIFSFDALLSSLSFSSNMGSVYNIKESGDNGERRQSLPEHLFTQIAKVGGELEALQVIVMMAPCRLRDLELAAPLLSAYKQLKSITYMANTDPMFTATPTFAPDPNTSSNEEATSEQAQAQEREKLLLEAEKRVVAAWHHACPTLRTIVLPRGQVWFKRMCGGCAHCGSGGGGEGCGERSGGGNGRGKAKEIWNGKGAAMWYCEG